MLITKEVEICCSGRNKINLLDKGYNWKSFKYIKINVHDLNRYSKEKIDILCDYCLEEGVETIVSKTYSEYITSNEIVKKDACLKCVPKKTKDIKQNINLEYFNSKIYNYGISQFNKLFKEKNIIPLVNTFDNSEQILPFKCIIHNEIFYSTLNNLKKKATNCKICLSEYRNKILRDDIEKIKNEFKLNHLIICEDSEYINSSTPIKCFCEFHPEEIQYINRQQAQRKFRGCSKCKENRSKGENNANWKGGITPDNQKIRHSEEYKEWRLEVFKRDNYTCKCCGDKIGGNLNAHHILNFAEYPELRFDIDNGITLCNLCHDFKYYGSFHHQYGTNNNTKEQLKEYIHRYKNNEFIDLRKLNNLII